MIPGYRVEGHAIVSADDRIADETGAMPPSLSNEADWRRFQTALDAAAVVVLGRLSHEARPNVSGRNRMVVSRSSAGIERRVGALWWNPARTSLADALHAAAPGGGIVAVPGGRLVFDLFLKEGFDAFHLARANRVRLPGGVPVFSEVHPLHSADEVLAAHGLIPAREETLDAAAGVTLVTWRQPAA